MRRFIPLIIIALIGSAVIGWLRAGTSAGPQPPAADGWDALLYQPPSKSDYQQMASELKASALLPLSLIVEQKLGDAATGANALNPTDAPPFPKVASSYVLNSTRYVQLIAADKSLIKAKAGDVLDSGWEIKSVDGRRVLAVFDGEEIEVPVIGYLQSAFEKSEEDAMDGDSDASMPPQSRQGGGE